MLSITNVVRGLFARSATPQRPRRVPRRLQLECLEERTLMCNPGELDLTFDADGSLTTNMGGAADSANGVAIQPDGKLVVAGATAGSSSQSTGDFAVARYNSNGTLDASFGAGGKVSIDFSGRHDGARGVAVQPDGKIVVVGWATPNGNRARGKDLGIVRLNTNGTVDKSFGKVALDVGGVA